MKRLLSGALALVLGLSLSLPAAALEVKQAVALLEDCYVDPLPPGLEELDSLDAVLQALGDPYTQYLSPEDYALLRTAIDGSTLVGIGVSIQAEFDNGFPITAVFPDSPAQRAGLEPGDVITGVDGAPLTPHSDLPSLIQGEAGTQVTLSLRRNGRELEVALTREEFTLPLVTYELEGRAAVLDCASFGATTVLDLSRALEELEDQAALWILDLRSNPGGTGQAAAGSAGLFIGSSVMVHFRYGSGEGDFLYTPAGYPDLTDKPLIILTSAASASAAEMFAAAIRDHEAGIALGQRTYGKGVGQQIFDASDFPGLFGEDAFKITVCRFYSPDGATNDTVGVIPTLLISPENTPAAALLLSCPQPETAQGYLKLELVGQTFYLDLAQARLAENQAAFTELLEALPPSAKLSVGLRDGFNAISPANLAETLGLPFTSRSFSDVDRSPFRDAIDTLACYRILSGREDGSFHPGETISRAEFCAMAAEALNFPAGPSGAFTDVAQDAWYAGAVNAMAARGFLSGFGDGTFRPDDPITYEQAVTVLDNLARWACTDAQDYARVPLSDQDSQALSQYSPWARTAVRDLGQLRALVGGLEPRQNCTREAAAGMLYALLKSAHLLWD